MPKSSATQKRRSLVSCDADDFGIKHNILRKLRGEGCKVTVVPAQTLAEDVLALKPDGVFSPTAPAIPSPAPMR